MRIIAGKYGGRVPIAEKDLEIRGPGELIGTRQSGLPGFWFADIVRDHKLLESAREEALNLVITDYTD